MLPVVLYLNATMVLGAKDGLEANSTSYESASTLVLHCSRGCVFTPEAPLAGAVGATPEKSLLTLVRVMTEVEVPAPEVPTTVTSKVVSGELAGKVMNSVEMPPAGTGLGLNTAVASAGKPVAESVTRPEKPATALVVISVLNWFGKQTISFREAAHSEKPAILGC